MRCGAGVVQKGNSSMDYSNSPLLSVEGLSVTYSRLSKRRRRSSKDLVVDRADLDVKSNEVLGILGESGSGKTTIAKALVGLATVVSGSVSIRGSKVKQRRNTLRPDPDDIQMVFQDPYSSLDPSMRVSDILTEPLLRIPQLNGTDHKRRVEDALESVHLSQEALPRYPSEFSGGQRQRIAIARGLVVAPRLLLLDEVVSALDVSTQATVLNLLTELSQTRDIGMIFITHDISVASYLTDKVAVMYDGAIIERGRTQEVLENPTHEFTRTLINAVPSLDIKMEE